MIVGELIFQAGISLTQFSRDAKTMETQLSAIPNRVKASFGNVNIAPNVAAGLGELKKQTDLVTVAARQMTAAEIAAAEAVKVGAANALNWANVGKGTVQTQQQIASAVAQSGTAARVGAANFLDWSAVTRTVKATADQAATAERQLAIATNQTAQAAAAAAGGTNARLNALAAVEASLARQKVRAQELAAVEAQVAQEAQLAAQQTSRAFAGVAVSTRGAGVSINSLRGPLTTLSAQLLGTNPALSSFSSILGSLAIGSVAMSGALLGLAALAAGYRLLTKDARESAKAQQDALDRVKELARVQALGIGGQQAADLKVAQDKLSALDRQIADARQRLAAQPSAQSQAAAGLQPLDIQGELNALVRQRAGLERDVVGAIQAQSDAVVNQTSDMRRLANQAVALAGLQDDAQKRQAVNFDATNQLIEAQRNLTGDNLALMKQVIEQVRLRRLDEIATASALKLQVEHLERMKQLENDMALLRPSVVGGFPAPALGSGPLPSPVPLPVPAGGQARGVDLSILERVKGAFGELANLIQAKLTAALLAATGAAALFAPILKGLNEVLRPAIDALIEPLVEVGRVIGNALLPVFRALTPIVKSVGDILQLAVQGFLPIIQEVTTWLKILAPIVRAVAVGMSFFTQALGEVIKFIGKAINLLPGSPGNRFVEMGQAMIDSARAVRAGTEATDAATESLRLFSSTLEGARQERELGNKLRGIELDPTQEISGMLNDLKNTFPILFARIFDGVNLNNMGEVRAAAVRFFDSIKDLSGLDLKVALLGAPIDEVMAFLNLFGDALNATTKAAQDAAGALRGVPEIFNFRLASIRAAGLRDFTPPTTGARTFGGGSSQSVQDNRTTVASGAVQITVTQDGDELLDRIAAVVATGLERAAALGGKTLTASEIRRMLKPELDTASQSKGEGARTIARNWPA